MTDADFEKDIHFGKIGEEIVGRLLCEADIAFDDLRDDPAARRVDVDFAVYVPPLGKVLIDVKTHSSWDRLTIEEWSDQEKGSRGCDYTSHAEWFVHVFPLTRTILSIRRQRFLDYVTKTETWNNLPLNATKTHKNGEEWMSAWKDWELAKIPGYGDGNERGEYPFDWWSKRTFELTDPDLRAFWSSPWFAKRAFERERDAGGLPKFKLGDVIRCPFCLDKCRPGNMKLKRNGKNGSIFFSCDTCYKELETARETDDKELVKSIRTSFDPDGTKWGSYVAKYPLSILKRYPSGEETK